jgi:hypothetical protein
MPTTRKPIRRQRVDTGLPIALLHYLATGDALSQEDGEAAFGRAFEWPDVYVPAAHPRNLAATYQKHHAEIEAHARAIGRARSWAAEQLDPKGDR